jgi:hypothetical protein
MIHLGQSRSRVVLAAIVKKRVYHEGSERSDGEEGRDRGYFGCSVIREKTLACALESMKRISSFPWTKQLCVMDTPGL